MIQRQLMDMPDEVIHCDWATNSRLGRELLALRTVEQERLTGWFAADRAKRCDPLLESARA